MSNKAKVVLACVTCLAVGYFAGREHIKYQMRTAMQDAVKQMQAGISSAFGGSETNVPEEPKPKALPTEQPITAVLIKKGFSPKDIYNGKYDEEVTMSVNFDNKTGKEIRAFDGILEITDLLGNKVITSRVEINQRIAQSSFLTWEGSLNYNQFKDDHQRFRAEPQDNLKAIFHAGKILFADGTTKDYE